MMIPITIETPHFLMDHHFQGQPVLPAVEAMAILAKSLKVHCPHLNIHQVIEARFDKFLYLQPDKLQLDAMVEFVSNGERHCQASLITRSKAPKSNITRTKIHAQISISEQVQQPADYPYDVLSVPEGICQKVSPESIYKELVPFGPTFQTIVNALYISAEGALAKIQTPPADSHTHQGLYLGSGYAMDAAFHAACVWSQHYHGVIAFPVAIDRRWILKPTSPEKVYFARIFMREAKDGHFVFDIRILDENGNLFEAADGIHMKDVSGGKMKPPPWIICKNNTEPVFNLKQHCQALTLIELDAVAPFAQQALNPFEKRRLDPMPPDRQKSYLAGRLALKRLWRRCHQENWTIAATEIATISTHSSRPACRHPGSQTPRHCSVSHDNRFAIAAGANQSIGIDVEWVSKKALKSSTIFMTVEEQALIVHSTEDPQQVCTRIWTIKEAVAKALNMNLADTWTQVQVCRLSEKQSLFWLNGVQRPVVHAFVEGHQFSLFLNSSK